MPGLYQIRELNRLFAVGIVEKKIKIDHRRKINEGYLLLVLVSKWDLSLI